MLSICLYQIKNKDNNKHNEKDNEKGRKYRPFVPFFLTNRQPLFIIGMSVRQLCSILKLNRKSKADKNQ